MIRVDKDSQRDDKSLARRNRAATDRTAEFVGFEVWPEFDNPVGPVLQVRVRSFGANLEWSIFGSRAAGRGAKPRIRARLQTCLHAIKT